MAPELNSCDLSSFSFVGLIHCVPYLLSSSIENSNKRLVYHTNEQLKVLLNLSSEQWITGPAGSGKTWMLIEKVKELGISRSGEKILVVCYSRPLSKMLEQQFEHFRPTVEVKKKKLLKNFSTK